VENQPPYAERPCDNVLKYTPYVPEKQGSC
jgi:hypothetical protein